MQKLAHAAHAERLEWCSALDIDLIADLERGSKGYLSKAHLLLPGTGDINAVTGKVLEYYEKHGQPLRPGCSPAFTPYIFGFEKMHMPYSGAGLLSVCVNPWNLDTLCIIAAGTHAAGTTGALYLLREYLEGRANYLGNNKYDSATPAKIFNTRQIPYPFRIRDKGDLIPDEDIRNIDKDLARWNFLESDIACYLRRTYDSIAPFYEQIFDRSSGNYSAVGREELQSMTTLASPCDGERILDVACGTGRLTVQLAGNSRRVVGVDISAKMLHMLRKKFVNSQFDLVIADALHLPCASNSFDLLVCMGMFEYYSPIVTSLILAEFRRVIRVDGRIVFSVQNQEAPNMEQYIADSKAELGVPIHTYRESDLAGMCSEAGLRINERVTAGLQLQVVAIPA